MMIFTGFSLRWNQGINAAIKWYVEIKWHEPNENLQWMLVRSEARKGDFVSDWISVGREVLKSV